MGRIVAAGVVLSMSLTAGASPLLTGAPVANSTTISIPLGGTAILAFDVTHDGFFTINHIEVVSATGAPDSQVLSLCFCAGDLCSCSASFVADSDEPGTWVIGFTAFDPATGLTSNQATVTILVGEVVRSGPERILEEMDFVLGRAHIGQLASDGAFESLTAKSEAITASLARRQISAALGQIEAFINELSALPEIHIATAVAILLQGLAENLKTSIEQEEPECPLPAGTITGGVRGTVRPEFGGDARGSFLYPLEVEFTVDEESGTAGITMTTSDGESLQGDVTAAVAVGDRTISLDLVARMECCDEDSEAKVCVFCYLGVESDQIDFAITLSDGTQCTWSTGGILFVMVVCPCPDEGPLTGAPVQVVRASNTSGPFSPSDQWPNEWRVDYGGADAGTYPFAGPTSPTYPSRTITIGESDCLFIFDFAGIQVTSCPNSAALALSETLEGIMTYVHSSQDTMRVGGEETEVGMPAAACGWHGTIEVSRSSGGLAEITVSNMGPGTHGCAGDPGFESLLTEYRATLADYFRTKRRGPDGRSETEDDQLSNNRLQQLMVTFGIRR